MIKYKLAATALSAGLLVAMVSTPAHAADDPGNPVGSGPTSTSTRATTRTVDGKKVPATTVTENYQLNGDGDAGATYDAPPPKGAQPNATWGASYAISTEQFQLYYDGKAKAAANVYQGKRIVDVCFWWTQDKRTSPTKCSAATGKGKNWVAGPEVKDRFNDTLDPGAPQTVFHIATTRIDPSL